MKINKNINLIYIVGNGRSGSTILELLLNTVYKTFTLGEINVIPWELKEEKQVCGCGKKASNCSFWRKVKNKSKDILTTKNNINKFRESHGSGNILRFKQLLKILLNKNISKSKIKEFCQDNFSFFNNVNSVLGDNVEYFIDSSKDPYRLYWLNKCENIEVKSIHLVKDPRAYVYSMIRKDNKVSTFKVIRKSLGYLVNNWVSELITKNENNLFLKYENMALNPDKTMKEISDWLKLEYSNGDYKKFRKAENHGLAGNKSRSRKDNIYLDEKWKKNFNFFHKKIVKIITYPLSRNYGYFK